MKSVWRLYSLILLLSVLVLAACGGNSGSNGDAGPVDPFLLKDPALKALTEEISNSPKDASLYFERGRTLKKMRQDTLALRDYMKAASLDSTKSEYFSAVGDMLFEAKDITGSIEWIQKAIKINPEDRKAHLKIAKLFLCLKDYGKALAEINLVLRKNVYDPEAYLLKGMVYKDNGDTAKAISSFLTSLQVAPDYKDAAIELGLLYNAKGDTIGLRYLDNAFAMDTTDVFPIYARGTHYQEMNRYDLAKQEYRRCILKDRKYTDAYFNMGYILLQEDSFQKAWRQFDMALKVDPGNPAAIYNRGLCSELMDSIDNAIADYKTSIRYDTGYEAPKKALGRLYSNKSKK